MEVIKIFDGKFHAIIREPVKSVLLENAETCPRENNSAKEDDWAIEKSNSLSCSYCRVQFENVQQQREHYKLDWHRYNLKQSLQSKPPVNEEEFSEKTRRDDDISSISGSDSDEKDTLDHTYATAQGKIFLQNHQGRVFSLYNCLILNDKNDDVNDGILWERLKNRCIHNQTWTVLMLGGGHFAGAVFKGDVAIVHKTFHCYTVRAGQGGMQSSRDGKSGGGSHPKSAGASLRRYNEQALIQHVGAIVETWRNEIASSNLIVYRASGSYNRSVLFGGGTDSLLNKNDPRLVTIPFSTRRATFKEVQRVHSVLTAVHIYRDLDSAVEHFSRQKLPEISGKRGKSRAGGSIDRAKSREIIERPLPVTLVTQESSSDDADDDLELICNDLEISLNDSLQEFDDSLTQEQRRSSKIKKEPKKNKAKKLRELEELRKKEIVDVLSKGRVDKLNDLLENHLKIAENEEKKSFVDEILDDDCNTLLHVAALNEQCETVEFLLKNNANPCIKNKKYQTAYTCTQSKEIRETLKQFAKDNPTKFNYNKAQIPTNTLSQHEIGEKRKAQRKIKKEKEKIKKEHEKVRKIQEQEKERFLNLTDREKRALAAERRILNQSGAVISRCFICGTDITGKVPFEYLNNRFCSVDCLKAHRLQNPVVLS